ncbi:MAG: TerC family protein [Candidatus Binatia bacterium]
MASEYMFSWVAFNVLVLGMLALDLVVFHRKAHVVSLREATMWSVIWICLALFFNLWLYVDSGKETALEFFTGYLIEKSLSVDNLFVFLAIFSYFAVDARYQHKILFWGILGALVMRGIFIAVGAALLTSFHWMIYVFGGFLIFTGIKMLRSGDEKLDFERNPLVRWLRGHFRFTNEYHGDKFFVRKDGVLWATPLFLVLCVVEFTDLIFAVDSIPAIFAVTTNPFIVYTSNVFAILGLRALYFLLAGVMEMFHYLKLGLSLVLVFVGVKMVTVEFYKMPIAISLGVIGGILGLSIIASLVRQYRIKTGYPGTRHAHHRRAATVFLWAIMFGVFAVLAAATYAAIARGASADDAILAVRLAESDFARAQQTGSASSLQTSRAERRIERAWGALETRRYDQAINAAHDARELLSGAD